jgi:hypothetical protein
MILEPNLEYKHFFKFLFLLNFFVHCIIHVILDYQGPNKQCSHRLVSPDWTIQAWSKNEANIYNIQHICPKSEDILTYKGFFDRNSTHIFDH